MCVRILIVKIKYSSLIHIKTKLKHTQNKYKQSCYNTYKLSLTTKCIVHHTNTNIEAKQCVSEYSQIQLSSNTLLSYKSTQTLNTYTKQIQTIMHNTYSLSLTTKCIVHHTNTNIEANNVCQNTHRYSYHQILFSHTNQHKTKHIYKTNTKQSSCTILTDYH